MSKQLRYYYQHKERINQKRREEYRLAQLKKKEAKEARRRNCGTE